MKHYYMFAERFDRWTFAMGGEIEHKTRDYFENNGIPIHVIEYDIPMTDIRESVTILSVQLSAQEASWAVLSGRELIETMHPIKYHSVVALFYVISFLEKIKISYSLIMAKRWLRKGK